VDAAEVLAATYLFRDLPPERLRELGAQFRRRSYRRGAFLFREGDPSEEVFILARGLVKGSRVGPEGGEVVDVMYWGAGRVFGEVGVVADGAPRIMDGLVLEDTDCLVVEREPFVRMLETEPLLMRRVLDQLARLLRERIRWISDLPSLDVTGRVARRLLEMSDAAGVPTEEGVRIEMRLSQATLAGAVLASRESVNRALASLIAEGAISQRSGSFVILDRRVLRHRARLADGELASGGLFH
jgi:CRP/FNR family cyclic AMP-dependent transcriptional regulator